MKNHLFLLKLCLILTLISCEKELVESVNYDENLFKTETNNVFYTDFSGQIEIIKTQHFTNSFGQSDPNSVSLTAYVPEGYVCIGGTALVAGRGNGPGALLTMSAPTLGADLFRGWRAKGKAHTEEEEFLDLEVHTIGMRIKLNDGSYLSAEQLKENLKLVQRRSSYQSNPTSTISLPNDYTIIGGGAQMNWVSFGNSINSGGLLTESYPSNNSWISSGTIHIANSIAAITSFAIGIKNTAIADFGNFDIALASTSNVSSTAFSGESNKTSFFVFNGDSDYAGTCPGAKSTFNNDGRMLRSIGTIGKDRGVAISNDHITPDTGTLKSYIIGIKKAQ